MDFTSVNKLLDAKKIAYETRSAGEQLYISCPVCKSEKKRLTIQNATGLFTCFLCGERGNAKKLLKILALETDTSFSGLPLSKEPDYDPAPIDPEIVEEHHQRLMDTGGTGTSLRQYLYDRGLLDETIKKFKLGWDGKNITIPLFNGNGDCMGMKLKPDPTRPSGSKGMFNVPGYKRMLFNESVLKNSNLNEIFLCFSPDTEILTDAGWRFISDINLTMRVAQYDKDSGHITFETPRATQIFEHDKNMISLQSKFSDILVTPEHRVLVNKDTVIQARDVKAKMKLPVSGIKTTNDKKYDLSEDQVRLLVAYLGDGIKNHNSYRRSWNLKKERKVIRLKGLLTRLNIPFEIRHIPSAKAWSLFLINNTDAKFLDQYAPDKKITTDALNWSLEMRQVFIDELRYWDGDGRETPNRLRFFTGVKTQADIISAMAVISGWGCTIREDIRENENTSYVLNMVRKSWRLLSKGAVSVSYELDKVYCLTTEKGFVIMKRNGKINIIGQCEGEWDTMLLDQQGLSAVTTTAGATGFDEKWCKWFKEIPKIYICFDVDLYTQTGQNAARDLARKFNKYGIDVYIIRLPVPPLYVNQDKFDVTDYFVKQKHTTEEFLRLSAISMPSVAPKKYKRDPLEMVHFYQGDQASKAYDNLYAQYGQGFSTGFEALDRHFRMLPQHLYLISATTFSGKTLLSLQMAVRMAKDGKKVLFFALETGLNVIKTIRDFYGTGSLPENLIVVDAEAYILTDTVMRAVEKIPNVDVVFVDHIHYFERDSARSMTAQIDQIIVDLQTIAKSHMLPIVLVAHVRKLNEYRAPTIDDLKDSASLGQIPSVILMLHRKRNTEFEIEQGAPEMLRVGHTFIRKNRITGSLHAEEFYIRSNQQMVFRQSDEWNILSNQEQGDYMAQETKQPEARVEAVNGRFVKKSGAMNQNNA